jgi:hypothetical protein
MGLLGEVAVTRSVYRIRLYRPLIVGLLTVFSLVDAFLWVNSAIGSVGPGWLFTLEWTAILGYLAWVFLWRTVYELHLDGDDLSWWTPLRSGTVRLSDVRELRPTRGTCNSELIRLGDGKALMVFTLKGFVPFVDDIRRQAPDLPVRVRPFFSQVAEKWPLQGSGCYERRD